MNYAYYVGLDVSKETFDASLIEFESSNEVAHRKFANSRKGICSLLRWVEVRNGIKLSDVVFCAEDMGNYILKMALCAADRTLKFNFSLISPLAIKYSMGIARGKNDRIDARRIAEYAVTHYRKIRLYYPAEKELCQLRTWLILRAHLSKQRVSKLVLLEKLDYKAKLADVSLQYEMLKDEIAYLESHLKEIEQQMQVVIYQPTEPPF
jgi:Transposase and inactivated derivatives